MGFWREIGRHLWRVFALFVLGVLSAGMTFIDYFERHGFTPWLWFGAAAFLQAGTLVAAHAFWKQAQAVQPSRRLSEAFLWLEELIEEGDQILSALDDRDMFGPTEKLRSWLSHCEHALEKTRGGHVRERFTRAWRGNLRAYYLEPEHWATNVCRAVLGPALEVLEYEKSSLDQVRIKQEWNGERLNPSTSGASPRPAGWLRRHVLRRP